MLLKHIVEQLIDKNVFLTFINICIESKKRDCKKSPKEKSSYGLATIAAFWYN